MTADLLTDAQLAAELARCEFCEEKPCRDGCPAHCSPADFLMAARVGRRPDIGRAAAEILYMNPLGGVCGAVCPDRFCQARCSRRGFDAPVRIPAVQATLVARARALGVAPRLTPPTRASGRRVAIVGAGPAGLAAAAVLAQHGHQVTLLERAERAGGALWLIPAHRLPAELVHGDLDFVLSSPNVTLRTGVTVTDPAALLGEHDAVIVATGLWEPIRLGVRGEERAVAGLDYLRDPAAHPLPGRVAVVGGGATAVDAAVTARRRGAAAVELLALETLAEMPLTERERAELVDAGVAVTGRTRVVELRAAGEGLLTRKVTLPAGAAFDPRAVTDVPGTDQARPDLDHLIVAIGGRPGIARVERPGVFRAGDCGHGPATVVEAVASGKTAAAAVDAFLAREPEPTVERPRKSRVAVPGHRRVPASLEVDFFGRRILSPLLLSAAPPSDGWDQMRKAFHAGWAGGVMKTAFDGVPIHIPADYMYAFDGGTWGNCDNVSGHPLDRVCVEIEKLVAEYPDRLVAASTGGPVTGDEEADSKGWQANTRKLESAGVHAIEYSLSCPQGGDGSEGAIVSQNARLTARIIDWILAAGDPAVPKLFKLTAAVTSIEVIVKAVREVLARHPGAKAGITLANTFPVLGFRPGGKPGWDDGIVLGMSGTGVAPISYLTLASVAPIGVTVSGNGGAMDYLSAAHMLALGARTVQMCTAVMKYGYGYVSELHSGLAHLLAARGQTSVEQLIGCALPEPVVAFPDLPAKKRISQPEPTLCLSCGNCTRCSYGAITLDAEKHPVVSPERCIGCSICTQKCFAGALSMRERTPEETARLRER